MTLHTPSTRTNLLFFLRLCTFSLRITERDGRLYPSATIFPLPFYSIFYFRSLLLSFFARLRAIGRTSETESSISRDFDENRDWTIDDINGKLTNQRKFINFLLSTTIYDIEFCCSALRRWNNVTSVCLTFEIVSVYFQPLHTYLYTISLSLL